MRYLPHTDEEIADMLRAVGFGHLDETLAARNPKLDK